MDVSIEIHCAACGSANYSLPGGVADEAPVRCNDCGRELCSVAELKAEMVAHALTHSAEAQRAELDRLRAGETAPGAC